MEAGQMHADYVGPVEIRQVDYACGHRGLFAKEPISASSIVLVSNAMAVAPNLTALLSQLQQRAASSKRSRAQIFNLLSVLKEVKEPPPMELFKPGSEWAPPDESITDGDIGDVGLIMKANLFAVGGDLFEQYLRVSNKDVTVEEPSGIWILPSFINHSCAPNCTHTEVGSVMLIRAMRDIRRDEELTFNYFLKLFSGLDSRQDRARELSFICRCERCLIESQLSSEFSSISRQMGVLVPRSQHEFANGGTHSTVTTELSDELEAFQKALVRMIISSKLDNLREGRATADYPDPTGNYEATRQLISCANRVEALIGSLVENPATHPRNWIRASFLEAHLAKYMLATVFEPDSSTRIGTLNVIVKAMMSICCHGATLILAHQLFLEVRGRYSKRSSTCKSVKNLLRQVLRSRYDDARVPKLWNMLLESGPLFDYRLFSFDM